MKPILFNTDMVRAILDGRKAVTRRVVKPQPRSIYHDGKIYEDDGLYVIAENQNGEVEQIGSPYRPGDILYVRETWQKNPYGIGWPYFYKASPEEFDHAPDKWRPSIHMPREAARIFLRVTDVKVQRVQDITDEEARREGCKDRDDFHRVWNNCYEEPQPMKAKGIITHYESYPWEDIQETRTYRGKPWYIIGNPWTWGIEFERCEKPGGA